MPDGPAATTHETEGSVADARATESWSLHVLHSPVPGLRSRRIELATRLGIGRAPGPGVELAIDDAKLSRLHATITRAGVVIEIHDHASRNGTFVNGGRIATRMLQRGDLVRVGDTLLELADGAPPGETGDPMLVGSAPSFVAAVALAARVADTAIPVLLLGETGTGKDVLAQYVHRQSGRRGPFVAVNCAALAGDLIEATLFGHRKGAFTGATSDSPGLFLEAQGGTLFLDEIGELGLAHQAKLLRALDAHEIIPVGATRSVQIDARVIAATNLDLGARTAAGRFRGDLYARLAGAVVHLPPLRTRRGDILALAERFLGPERRLSAQAAERLVTHPWPRNVRELQAAMRLIALQLGERTEIRRADLDAVLELPVASPDEAVPASGEARLPGMPSRDELATQLAGLHGNVSRLAAFYGKDAKQIYRWLKRYQLDPDSYR